MRFPMQDGGRVAIFQIEGQFPKRPSSYGYSEQWCIREMSPSHFGEDYPKRGDVWKEVAPLFAEYGANGECWQKTGHNGFLNESIAWQAIDAVLNKAPPDAYVTAWRLVRREIDVEFTVLRIGTPVGCPRNFAEGACTCGQRAVCCS